MEKIRRQRSELIDLQREITGFFQVSARLLAQFIPQSMSGRRGQSGGDNRTAGNGSGRYQHFRYRFHVTISER
jgi:hypothetical protein